MSHHQFTDDGGGSYTIAWPGGTGMAGWDICDWTSMLVDLMVMLRGNDPRLEDRATLEAGMAAVCKMTDALEAARDALIEAGRRTVDGEPVMSFADIGTALGVTRSTIETRHARLEAGEHARRAHWLVGAAAPLPSTPLAAGYAWATDVLTLANPAAGYARLVYDTSEAAAAAAAHIRARLHNPDSADADWIVKREMTQIRDVLPAEVLADPDAGRAVELAGRALFILNVLLAGRGIAGDPELRALASIHHAGGTLTMIGVLARQLTDLGASTGDILDGVTAGLWSHAVVGYGSRAESPYNHNERRSADLAQAHALALKYPRERAARLWTAVMGTTCDDTTKAQLGAADPDIVVRAVARNAASMQRLGRDLLPGKLAAAEVEQIAPRGELTGHSSSDCC